MTPQRYSSHKLNDPFETPSLREMLRYYTDVDKSLRSGNPSHRWASALLATAKRSDSPKKFGDIDPPN
ncbi:hypothetical protein RRF57_012399 [Xylaria bambusicola]|uniref:Uncharacterized protein n=1 Tax=Xylaria bambusicola TaxID=326684 RepID=A0AAN7UV47_9PEZI